MIYIIMISILYGYLLAINYENDFNLLLEHLYDSFSLQISLFSMVDNISLVSLGPVSFRSISMYLSRLCSRLSLPGVGSHSINRFADNLPCRTLWPVICILLDRIQTETGRRCPYSLLFSKCLFQDKFKALRIILVYLLCRAFCCWKVNVSAPQSNTLSTITTKSFLQNWRLIFAIHRLYMLHSKLELFYLVCPYLINLSMYVYI